MIRSTAQFLKDLQFRYFFHYHAATFGTWTANLCIVFSHFSFSRGKLNFLSIFSQPISKNEVHFYFKYKKLACFGESMGSFSTDLSRFQSKPTGKWLPARSRDQRAECILLARHSPLSISSCFTSVFPVNVP